MKILRMPTSLSRNQIWRTDFISSGAVFNVQRIEPQYTPYVHSVLLRKMYGTLGKSHTLLRSLCIFSQFCIPAEESYNSVDDSTSTNGTDSTPEPGELAKEDWTLLGLPL